MKFNKAKNKVLKYDKLMQKELGSDWVENGFAGNVKGRFGQRRTTQNMFLQE